MENKLKAPGQRAIQYWFIDGLAEISGGAVCMLLAIYFGLQQALSGSPGLFALVFLLVFLAAFGIRRLMLSIREHSTYPRTGYVEPKRGWEDRQLRAITIIFTTLLLGFMLFTILRGIQTMEVLPVTGGVIFAFIFAMAAYEAKVVRFYFLAGFSLLLGALLAFSGLGDFWGTAILSFGTGLVLLAFGGVTRLTYLRQVKLLARPSDER